MPFSTRTTPTRTVPTHRRARPRPARPPWPAAVAAVLATAVAVTAGVLTTGGDGTLEARPGVGVSGAPLASAAGALAATRVGLVVVDGVPVPTLLPGAAGDVRAELRDRFPGSAVTVSRSADRTALVARVRTPAPVTVVADGHTRLVASTRRTAVGVLAQAGLQPDADDLVRVRPGTAHRRVQVRLIRVRRTATVRETGLRPGTVRHTVTTLAPGQTRVVEPGVAGQRRVRWVRVFHDGRLVSQTRRLVSVTRPVPRVVEVGAAAPVLAAAAAGPGERWPRVPGTGGLDWAALAACEASGNPRAVNPAGYYGLYQFDLGTWATVGGVGNPADASPGEQTYRAQRLYAARGASPWPVCGRLL